MHILHTVLYTIPQVLTRRICLPIKRFLHWWSFPIVRSGKEKMCNKFKKINNTFWKNVSTVLLSSSVQVCTKYKKNVKYILRKCWLNKTNNSSRRMYAEHRVQRELCVYLKMWEFLSLTKCSCTHVDKCWEVSPASTTFQLKIKEAIQTSPLTKVTKFLQWPLYLSERWVTWTQMTQPNLSKTRFLLTHFFGPFTVC